MAGLQRFENALLRVKHLDAAVDFYTHVMGMTEIAREDGIVYLGCGLDGNYDLAVVEGGTGVSRYAVRIDSEEMVQRYEAKLKEVGVASFRIDNQGPNVECGVRFAIPSGITMELVVVKDNFYHRPADPPILKNRTAVTPLDADHINLLSLEIKKDVEFMRDVLGFYWSDVKTSEAGFYNQVFTRFDAYHHDVAFGLASSFQQTLHHYALTMANFDHMKIFSDRLSQCGFQLEVGINRHVTGSNLFLYFWEPGGNRIELCTEMGTLSPNTPTRYTQGGFDRFAAWGGLVAPLSFTKGS